MIAGIGTDLCRIDRMEKSLESPAFCRRVFGGQEKNFLDGLKGKKLPESAAANFAAKEAFLKAAGRGIGDFAFGEVQALRAESGAPYFVFEGKARDYMEQNRLKAHLSLTHEAGLAAAFVILEREDV